ncbi:putative transporter small subunit [Nocardiopsis algeriensis]
MGTLALTAYVLVWPAIVAAVLFFLVRGFVKDWREAREEGRPII